MIISIDDPLKPEILALLKGHLADMARHSPVDSVHALDPQALTAEDVTFWAAWRQQSLLGCGALKRLNRAHAEIKSMCTAPAERGNGVATAILEAIVEQARADAVHRLSLETGSAPVFAPARALYSKFGFEYCPPFADYQPDPYSCFMTLVL